MSSLERRADYFVGCFDAMASRCEILIDTDNTALTQHITEIAESEVQRIEKKYSRYRNDSILHHINSGVAVEVDKETARLLDYAQQLYQLSNGLFDITSGVLRRVWQFDGSDNIPSLEEVNTLMPLIGWDKVEWNNPHIQLPTGMEIDFGGIGKEYAADRAANLVSCFINEQTTKSDRTISVLLNLGGDLAVTGPRKNGEGWRVGVTPGVQYSATEAAQFFSLEKGGVATSGDTNRYLQKGDVRYSHVLDPCTGWPVTGAPHAVTVLADTCTDAGMLSTLALLHGAAAEQFLREQGVPYYCQW